MIYDKIENASAYYGIAPSFEKAIKFMLSKDLNTLPTGEYPTGDAAFRFEIKEYTSTADSVSTIWSHHGYGEIWILLEGEEVTKIAREADCEAVEPYSEEKDLVVLKGVAHTVFPIAKDHFVVVMPGEGHGHAPISAASVHFKKAIARFRV